MGSVARKLVLAVATMTLLALRTLMVRPDSACWLSRTEYQPLISTMPDDGKVTVWIKLPAAPLTSKYNEPPPVGVAVGLFA